MEAFAKLATALCSWRLGYSFDLSSPIVTTMGFVEIEALPFAGTSHIAVASFAKASMENWQRICITGASSGLGWALAMALARPGATLLLSGRSAERLAQLALLVQEKGARALVCAADLATTEGQQSLIAAIEREVPDLLIHSAGLGSYGRFVDTPVERSLEIMEVNVMAIMTLTHAWCRALISRSMAGKVLFVSSAAAFLPFPGMTTYAASKTCLTSFAEGLRYELEGHGISVLTVCPGHFATNFRRRAAGEPCGDPSSKEADHMARKIIRVLMREGVYIPLPWRWLLAFQWLIPRRWLMRYFEQRVLAYRT